MKKILPFCEECGESKLILTQVSSTVEVKYLCSACYKDKYLNESQKEIK